MYTWPQLRPISSTFPRPFLGKPVFNTPKWEGGHINLRKNTHLLKLLATHRLVPPRGIPQPFELGPATFLKVSTKEKSSCALGAVFVPPVGAAKTKEPHSKKIVTPRGPLLKTALAQACKFQNKHQESA